MPDTNKKTIKARTSSHSDVSTKAAVKDYQTAQTEKQFGDALIRHLRENPAGVRLSNFQEEWISTDDGLVYELRIDAEPLTE
jgi:hypothetical protein